MRRTGLFSWRIKGSVSKPQDTGTNVSEVCFGAFSTSKTNPTAIFQVLILKK